MFCAPLPFILFYVIEKNKPRGSMENPDITYDECGREVPFDDFRYLERIEADPEQVANPYRSLYRGFERKWAWYKVVQLFLKLLLVCPAIFFWDNPKNAVFI